MLTEKRSPEAEMLTLAKLMESDRSSRSLDLTRARRQLIAKALRALASQEKIKCEQE